MVHIAKTVKRKLVKVWRDPKILWYKLRQASEMLRQKCSSFHGDRPVPEIRFATELKPIDDAVEYKVSVVLPTLNAGSDMSFLLSSLRRQKKCEVQIVVVDSGSTDATLQIAQSFAAEIVQLEPGAFTHAHARNEGVARCKHDTVLCTVQDALPTDDMWLWKFCHIFAAADCVAMSCMQIPRSNATLSTCYGLYTYNDMLFGNRQTTIITTSLDDNTQAVNRRKQCQLDNVCCLYRKNVLEQFPFCGQFAEDLQMGLTLLKSNMRIGRTAEIKIIHSHTRPLYWQLRRSLADNYHLAKLGFVETMPDNISWNDFVDALPRLISRVAACLDDWNASRRNRCPLDLTAISGEREECRIGTEDGIRVIAGYDPQVAEFLAKLTADRNQRQTEHGNFLLPMIQGRFQNAVAYHGADLLAANASISGEIVELLLSATVTNIGYVIACLHIRNDVPTEFISLVDNLMQKI